MSLWTAAAKRTHERPTETVQTYNYASLAIEYAIEVMRGIRPA